MKIVISYYRIYWFSSFTLKQVSNYFIDLPLDKLIYRNKTSNKKSNHNLRQKSAESKNNFKIRLPAPSIKLRLLNL